MFISESIVYYNIDFYKKIKNSKTIYKNSELKHKLHFKNILIKQAKRLFGPSGQRHLT